MPFTVLQLSVGSLVGQNLFEMLTSRRQHFKVVGTNTLAETPNHFLCDQSYLTPPVQAKAFAEAFARCVSQHQPDLILPGRDDDVVFLANWRETHPEDAHRIVSGPAALAHLLRDKEGCISWAQSRQLPVARSKVLHADSSPTELQRFLKEVGLPCILKPLKGDGSRGVYVIREQKELEHWTKDPHQRWLLQEYLSPPEIPALDGRLPLFFQIPEKSQYAAQSLIHPDGKVGPVFYSVSEMVMGRPTGLQRVDISEFAQLAEDYCQAISEAGWRGIVNIQAKPDTRGQWKMHELNLRMSGGTPARLMLGYDELGELLNAFYPRSGFQPLTRKREPLEHRVVWQQHPHLLKHPQISHLNEEKQWP